MRSFIIVIMLFAVSRPLLAQEKTGHKGIRFFEGSWKEAVTKAKAENKYIFLDAFASWCVPCKTMEAEVYTDSAIGQYFNEKFISVKVDMEEGEGPRLVKIFPSIDGYPSLLFFDPQGHLNKTLLGSRKVEDFLREAKLVAR